MSNQTTERSFGRRLWWIFRTTIVSLLLIAVLAGLVYGGFLLFTEVQRSFTTLDVRLNSVERNQNLIREEVDEFRRVNPVLEVQLTNLDEDVDQMRSRLSLLEETLTSDLSALTAALTELEGETGALAEDTAALNEAIAALQSDINANTTDIDTLGGDIDTIAGALEALDAGMADVAAAQETLLAELPSAQYVQETLVLFQLWELIGRARLRLLENNIGLAADDVAAAQLRAELAQTELLPAVAVSENAASADEDATGEEETSAAETAGALPTEADLLASVASRLALAAANLPDNPDLAVVDLEVAWNTLDDMLVSRLQPALIAAPGPDEGVTAEDDAVEEESAEPADEAGQAEDEEESEGEATATPTVTPAPTTTPSPTPSPTPSG